MRSYHYFENIISSQVLRKIHDFKLRSLPYLSLALAASASHSAFGQTDIFDTHLQGAIVLGVMADGSVRVRLIDGSTIMLRPGTFSLQDDKVYVEAAVASTIQTSTIDSATTNSNSIDDLPVFTNASRVEVQAGQEFLLNVDANIAGDSSGLTYSLVGGGAADALNIDPLTGVIRLNPGATLQTEDATSQIVVVRVTNAQGDFAEQAISIAPAAGYETSPSWGNPWVLAGGVLGALGLAGLGGLSSDDGAGSSGGGASSSPAPGPSFSSSTSSATMLENATVVAGYQASAGSSASFEISNVVDNTGMGLGVNDFAISGAGSLAYTGSQAMDLEAMGGNTIEITITATLNSQTDTQVVTLTIQDVDEFDVAFTSAAPALALDMNENAEGEILGYTADANDGDVSDDVAYTITGVRYSSSADDPGLTPADFSIDANGTISVVKAGGLNFETLTETLILTVTATSDDGSTAAQDVEISVQNMNDAPEFSPASVNILVDETQASNLYQVIAVDDDNANSVNDAMFYEIFAGNDAGIFQINSATGHVSFVDPTNEANDGAYNLSIRATDDNSAGDPAGTMSGVLSLGILASEIA